MALPQKPVSLFWFRRDLRLHDNAGLHAALSSGQPVLPLFILDTDILDKLDNPTDRRVEFIYRALSEIQDSLTAIGSTLMVKKGKPRDVILSLLDMLNVAAVFTNHDYEPYARTRDDAVKQLLEAHNIPFHSFKDQVVFEKNEVLTNQDQPYTVFTPFSKTWKAKLNKDGLAAYPSAEKKACFVKTPPMALPTLAEIGFSASAEIFPDKSVRDELIHNYHETRNYPARAGTSRLSVHLRFGTVSIRELVRRALALNETWLNELIWREFYMMILWHHPHVVDQPFREKYAAVPWRDDEKDFQRWCEGKTGYPMVDAGMRELNETGFMHNRVRMVTASFLTKHLLIDWRRGERYFAKKLLDYDLSANNGNWQWAAGCGCDAAPYFRIFNPTTQIAKYDPEHHYIRKWVSELNSLDYPDPIVEHKYARQRCLDAFKSALN